MTSLGNQIGGIVRNKDNSPSCAVIGQNVLIIIEEHLCADTIVELADCVHTQGYGVQFSTKAELPILQEFNDQVYQDLVKAKLVECDSASADPRVCPGARVLMTLKQFVGPLDQQIIHNPTIINDAWIAQKVERLSKLFIDLKSNQSVEFNGGSFLQQAQSLKTQALECLCRADLGSFCTVRTEKRLVAREVLPSDGRFNYTPELARLLGDNLVAVIAYGGSVTAPGLDGIRDFDNFAIVKDATSAYEILRSSPVYYLGKPVHLQLIPQAIAHRYLLMSYNGPDTLKVVHGEAEIPVLDQSQEIAMMMTDLAVNVFNKRRSLLSTFIPNPQIFIDKVRDNPNNFALVAAHTVIPLAQIGWVQEYVKDPSKPRIGKREAAQLALESSGLPKLSEAFLDPDKFLALSTQDVKRELADSINQMSKCMTCLYNSLKVQNDDLSSASLF